MQELNQHNEPLLTSNSNLHQDELFTIVGAGPVGLATALLFSKDNIKTEIYERLPEIVNTFDESYPIGINPRTLHTLKTISPELEQLAISEGLKIDAWEIYAGERRVARQDSGVVYGSSRANVNLLLYKAAKDNPLIKIYFNHKVHSINDAEKLITFEYQSENSEKILKTIKTNRIIAADGVFSSIRGHLEKNLQFKSEIIPWMNTHRGLFGIPGKTNDELDVGIHYIFNSTYVAAVMNEGRLTWSFSLTASCNLSEEDNKTILETVPSEENIAKLKKLIMKQAPKIMNSLTEEELVKYFSRRTFTGAVVKCEKYNIDEWILLLGDAAHSVLPPTGEGLNSGMEDAYILYDTYKKSGINDLFNRYNKFRVPDLHGLFEYAKFLNDSSQMPGEAAAKIIFTIAQGCFKRQVFNELFGKDSIKRLNYKDIFDSWNSKKFWIINTARIITYPIGIVIFILTPWRWGICCSKNKK